MQLPVYVRRVRVGVCAQGRDVSAATEQVRPFTSPSTDPRLQLAQALDDEPADARGVDLQTLLGDARSTARPAAQQVGLEP